ncbi:hypothetical protein BGX28_008852 [Mortierella sp. GBA30]|nr:hypothetical protein BGX28_008852 [Mortierella sp. GBA30]
MHYLAADTTGQLQPEDRSPVLGTPISTLSHSPDANGHAGNAAPASSAASLNHSLNSVEQTMSSLNLSYSNNSVSQEMLADRSNLGDSHKNNDSHNNSHQQQPLSHITPAPSNIAPLHLDIGGLQSFSEEIESYLTSSSSPSDPPSASSSSHLPTLSSFLLKAENETCHTKPSQISVNIKTDRSGTGAEEGADTSAQNISVTTIGSSLPELSAGGVDSAAQGKTDPLTTSITPLDSAPAPATLSQLSSDLTTSKEQPLSFSSSQEQQQLIQPTDHTMAPSISQTQTMVINDNGLASNISSSDHYHDRDHTSSRLSSSSFSTSLSLSTSSSTSEHQRGYQLSDGPVSTAGSKMLSMTPLQIPPNDGFLNPVPQKSEDWAALVDTPASPIQAHHHHMMAGQPPQLRGLMNLGGGGYTESPAPEDVTGAGPSADYMQHISQHHPSDPTMGAHLYHPHQQHHNFPYQHQQHYSSTSSVPLQQTGQSGTPNDNRRSFRKSWSASENLNGSTYSNSAYGYMTPPRLPSDANGRSPSPRPHGSQKQSSVATSVSLLTDAAILAKYRETAIKTKDASIQLSYAKYLLEIGEPCPPGTSFASEDTSRPSSASGSRPNSPPASGPPSPTTATIQPDPQNGKRQLTLEAIYWIDRLAKEGQPEAQFIKGSWYEDGSYMCKKSTDKALRYYQSASKGDYGPAHYKYGYYCEKKKDNNKAVMLYKKAAVHNDVPANHRLAVIYLYGELGQSKNMKAGLQYLKRAASFATETAPMSPYVLGLILSRDYNKNLVIPDDIAFPDDGEALEWFRKSAQLRYGPANYKLGYCYEYGSLGCPIDPFLSLQHYERAILAGDSNGEAEMALSGWYLSGAENYFAADDQLAFDYATKAAEKELPKAQYAMGYYHEVGIATPIDMEKAMEFYKLAAANGNLDAQRRLEEQSAKHDKMGHKNSIRRLKQGRHAKDQSCSIM